MEMIVCIFFFSLSAAVSAQMFAKSHVISHTAIDENHAVLEVNNLAESFYAEHGDLSSISEKLYGHNSSLSDNKLSVYFDGEFRQVSPGSSSYYTAELTITEDAGDSGLKKGNIAFYKLDPKKGSKLIYSLDVAVDVPHMIP